MKMVLIAICAAALFSGCATNRSAATDDRKAEQDARIVRGLLDSMASAPHSFPASVPR